MEWKHSLSLSIRIRIDSSPLLSRASLKRRWIKEIRPDGSFAKPNDLKIVKDDVNVSRDECSENGIPEIGKIRNIRNDSELYVKFYMKPGIAPIV